MLPLNISLWRPVHNDTLGATDSFSSSYRVAYQEGGQISFLVSHLSSTMARSLASQKSALCPLKVVLKERGSFTLWLLRTYMKEKWGLKTDLRALHILGVHFHPC